MCCKKVWNLFFELQNGHKVDIISNRFRPRPINVNQALRTYFEEKGKSVLQEGRELVLNLPSTQISIFSDAVILTNTLDYLIENAIDATQQGKIEFGYDVYNETKSYFSLKIPE